MGHLVQPPCRSRVTYSRLHRTVSRWVFSISREGDSTTSLGSLFQRSITLRGKKVFLVLPRRNDSGAGTSFFACLVSLIINNSPWTSLVPTTYRFQTSAISLPDAKTSSCNSHCVGCCICLLSTEYKTWVSVFPPFEIPPILNRFVLRWTLSRWVVTLPGQCSWPLPIWWSLKSKCVVTAQVPPRVLFRVSNYTSFYRREKKHAFG